VSPFREAVGFWQKRNQHSVKEPPSYIAWAWQKEDLREYC
jgi:hypothetical protein